MYDDGRPGEVFIKMAKEGSTLSGVMDGLALTISLGLQYGVPLKVFVDKLLNTRFEPSGITANANIRFVSSVLDYIARWLGGRFISADRSEEHTSELQSRLHLVCRLLPDKTISPLPSLAQNERLSAAGVFVDPIVPITPFSAVDLEGRGNRLGVHCAGACSARYARARTHP